MDDLCEFNEIQVGVLYQIVSFAVRKLSENDVLCANLRTNRYITLPSSCLQYVNNINAMNEACSNERIFIVFIRRGNNAPTFDIVAVPRKLGKKITYLPKIDDLCVSDMGPIMIFE